MKSSVKEYLTATAGFLLLAAGLFLAKTTADPQGIMKALPYVCIGVGCGLFGQGMGTLLQIRAVRNSPEIQKKIEIEKKDERNAAIASRAKSKAYDMMTFVFGALMLAYALMGVELTAILLLVSSYLFVEFYGVYCRIRLDKEM